MIAGATVNVQATVANTASVLFTNGADGLDYAITGAGGVVGTAVGLKVPSLTAGKVHSFALNTAAPRLRSGTLSASSSSEAVATRSFSQALSTTVLAHASPSFNPTSEVNVATIDFGIRGRGLAGAVDAFFLANLADASGFTAAVDLDSVIASGDDEQFTISLGTVTQIAPAAGQRSTGRRVKRHVQRHVHTELLRRRSSRRDRARAASSHADRHRRHPRRQRSRRRHQLRRLRPHRQRFQQRAGRLGKRRLREKRV